MSYEGRSSLSAWLRVVVSNRAINIARLPRNVQIEQLGNDVPDASVLDNIDRIVRARRYSGRMADSMMSACNRLTSTESLLLLWRYEDGLKLGQIAKLMDIHQSNVTRRLSRIHRKLHDGIIAILSVNHGLSDAAIQECLNDAVENPHLLISVLDCIRQAQAAKNEYFPSPPKLLCPEM